MQIRDAEDEEGAGTVEHTAAHSRKRKLAAPSCASISLLLLCLLSAAQPGSSRPQLLCRYHEPTGVILRIL